MLHRRQLPASARTMPVRLAAAVLIGLAAFAPGAALAHPHVWIDAVTTFVFKGDSVVGVRFFWRFDELFSSYVIGEFDRDRNGVLSGEEQRAVKAGAFDNLKEHGYFAHVDVDGRRVRGTAVGDFNAVIRKGRVAYQFTLVLPAPVDARRQRLTVGVYDETYYVDVGLDEHDPVRLEGAGAAGCAFEVREDVARPIYFGMVFPRVVDLRCTASG